MIWMNSADPEEKSDQCFSLFAILVTSFGVIALPKGNLNRSGAMKKKLLFAKAKVQFSGVVTEQLIRAFVFTDLVGNL